MIVLTIYGIIIFHLTEWMRLICKSLTKVLMGYGLNMLAFSFLAIPTRHEVSEMPMFGYILLNKRTKLSKNQTLAKTNPGLSIQEK